MYFQELLVEGAPVLVKNLLSSTTPFGGHEDTPILDIVRGIFKGRPVNESC